MATGGFLRGTLVPLALVAVGVGIGWLLFHRAVPPSTPLALRADGMERSAPSPVLEGAPVAARPEARIGTPPHGGLVPAVPVPRIHDGVAGRIDVTLDVPEGWPPLIGHVYALPAGAPGVDDVALVPHAQVFRDDHVLLPVPRAGRWDVFLTARTTVGAVLDVEVPAGESVPVNLKPYPSAPIRFELEDDLPAAWTRDRHPVVKLFAAATRPRLECPGRHEHARLKITVPFDEHGVALTPPLAEGRSYPVGAFRAKRDAGSLGRWKRARRHYGSHRMVVERSAVEAGDVVSVRLLERAALRLRVRVDAEPPPSWKGWQTHVGLRLEVEGGIGGDGTVRIGSATSSARVVEVVLWGDPGLGRVRWSGSGIVPGAVEDVALRVGAVAEREVVVEVKQAFDPYTAFRVPDDDVVEVRAEGWRDDERSRQLHLFGIYDDEHERGRCHEHNLAPFPERSTYVRSRFPAEEVIAFQRPDRVSRPTKVDASGELHLELERGGFLVAIPDLLPHASLGRLRVRRADGRPLARASQEEEGLTVGFGHADLEIPLWPGSILGPLPPGKHRFEVFLGAVRLPDVEGTVSAGGLDLLRIRR